jgi:hypothetical protein
MKVVLARYYRIWMLVLLPTTVGLGTVALWLRSIRWPLWINERGVVLRRHHGRVGWNSVSKIALARRYIDGRCSQIRIYHGKRISKIPVDALEDGQAGAGAMIAMFARAHGRSELLLGGQLNSAQQRPPVVSEKSAHRVPFCGEKGRTAQADWLDFSEIPDISGHAVAARKVSKFEGDMYDGCTG